MCLGTWCSWADRPWEYVAQWEECKLSRSESLSSPLHCEHAAAVVSRSPMSRGPCSEPHLDVSQSLKHWPPLHPFLLQPHRPLASLWIRQPVFPLILQSRQVPSPGSPNSSSLCLIPIRETTSVPKNPPPIGHLSSPNHAFSPGLLAFFGFSIPRSPIARSFIEHHGWSLGVREKIDSPLTTLLQVTCDF